MSVLVTLAVVALAGLALAGYLLLRFGAALRNMEHQREVRNESDSAQLESKLRELAAAQNEIAGRFSQAIESQAKGQSELQRAVAERLEALDKRLGENLKDSATKTAETLDASWHLIRRSVLSGMAGISQLIRMWTCSIKHTSSRCSSWVA